MNPRNGDVLGLANRPAFNATRLNDYAEINEEFINPAVSLVYDPGSTFKIMTMAAGLDSGVITPGTRHNLPGTYEYWGLEFSNWDGKNYPSQNMVSVLANSSNTGAIFVADRLGPDSFYSYIRNFGFGNPTGIDLANEVQGILKARGAMSWYPSDLAANSFGQSISTTPIQMAAAFGAIANGGSLMQPRAAGRIVTAEGMVIELEPSKVRQVIRQRTSHTLIDMMQQAEHSVGNNLALSNRFSTVGKTGTAEIAVGGELLPEQTIASYIGFGPRNNPQILVSVKIDQPNSGIWGSQVASPVFRKVVDRVFPYLRIPGDT
jgi:cell division protein FtsI/penicillin-binding protein 2